MRTGHREREWLGPLVIMSGRDEEETSSRGTEEASVEL